MAIDRLRTRSWRPIVVWFNTDVPPEAIAPFEAREHAVARYNAQQLASTPDLASVGAVVFTQSDAGVENLKLLIKQYAPLLLNHGCTVIVRMAHSPKADASFRNMMHSNCLPFGNLIVGTAHATSQINQSTEGDTPLPHVRFYGLEATWESIANFIAIHPADVAPDTNVNIEPRDTFSEEKTLLLQRAFANYVEVHLKQLDTGRSGAKAYRANGRKRGFNIGWTQPHFVKIGLRSAITKEYFNYDERVDPYIPFHLTPNIQKEQCCLGAKYGLLLGDYVDGSESLEVSAKDNRAAHAIACLFERTLRGWYSMAYLDTRMFVDMDDYELKNENKFPAGRIDEAKKIGANLDIKVLGDLLKQFTSKRWLRAPVHNDLHAKNVLVRASDAIVIDFQQHNNGLILRDMACLEVSLLVDGFQNSPYEDRKDPAKFDGDKWRNNVEKLYFCDPTANHPDLHMDPKSHAHWFHLAVRQIRIQARPYELEPGQYAAALALELLIKSSRDNCGPFENYRRATAYYLAERLCTAFRSPTLDR